MASLWQWRRLAATAPIRPPAWEPPCATGAALEKTNKTKQTKTKMAWPKKERNPNSQVNNQGKTRLTFLSSPIPALFASLFFRPSIPFLQFTVFLELPKREMERKMCLPLPPLQWTAMTFSSSWAIHSCTFLEKASISLISNVRFSVEFKHL